MVLNNIKIQKPNKITLIGYKNHHSIKVRFMQKGSDPKIFSRLTSYLAKGRVKNHNRGQRFYSQKKEESNKEETNEVKQEAQGHKNLKNSFAEPNNNKLTAQESIKDLDNRRELALNDYKLPKVYPTANQIAEDCSSQGIEFKADKTIPFHPQVSIENLIQGSASLSHSRISEEAQKNSRIYLTETTELETFLGQQQYLHLRLDYENKRPPDITAPDWKIMDDVFTSPNIALNEKNIRNANQAVSRHNQKLPENLKIVNEIVEKEKQIKLKLENEKLINEQERARTRAENKKALEKKELEEKSKKHAQEIEARKLKLKTMRQNESHMENQNLGQSSMKIENFGSNSNIEKPSNENIND